MSNKNLFHNQVNDKSDDIPALQTSDELVAVKQTTHLMVRTVPETRLRNIAHRSLGRLVLCYGQ